MRMAWHILLLLGLLAGLLAPPAPVGAEEVALRLVSLIDRDDQGEDIGFPYGLYYDYWASETYLVSTSNRITVYDHKFFPVASFGRGRGLAAIKGLTVDRHGNIYVTQIVDSDDAGKRSRLSIYSPAFFLIREIFVSMIPELLGFSPAKVAVAESGEIYLTGHFPGEELAGVAVLTPEGSYLRTLRPPEKSAPRAPKKKEPVPADGDQASPAPELAEESTPGSELAAALPAGLKPKAAAGRGDEEEDQETRGLPYISDVKIDRQGRIYLVSREVSHVYVFNGREEYLFKFGEKGGADGKLSTPAGLAVDIERRVFYVVDYMRHTILCYDYDSGRFIFEFGGRGTSPLWFNYPNSIEVDQRGRVLVSDQFNRRVQVIDPNLEERKPILKATPAEPALPSAPPSPASELSGVAPEASGVAPEVSAVAPEGSVVAPEPSSAPELSGVAPELSGIAPESSRVAPELPGLAPEVSGVAPEASGVAPVVSGAASVVSVVAPEISGVAPELPSIAPELPGVAPGLSGIAPESSSVAPELSSLAPEVSGVAPEPSSAAPELSGVTPVVSVVAPEISGVAPEPPRVAPELPGVAPELSGIAPEPSRFDPELSGVAPGVSGVAPEPPDAGLLAPRPPVSHALAPLEEGAMPVGVQAPALPVLAAGSGLAAVRSAGARLNPPPARAQPQPVRALAAKRLKKSAPPRRVVLAPPILTVPRSPRPMISPGVVRLPRNDRTAGTARRPAAPADRLVEGLGSLPGAVGVYGPVAVILGVGGRLLSTNR